MSTEDLAELLRRAAHMLETPGNYSYAELDATAASLRVEAAKADPTKCAKCPNKAEAGYSEQEPMCGRCWTEKALSQPG